MTEGRFNHGDKVYFFNQFPFDYKGGKDGKFYEMEPGIECIQSPNKDEICKTQKDIEIYYAIFFLSKFSGIGRCHFAIKLSKIIADSEIKFWNIILGFRLVKPLKISIAGSVEFDQGENVFKQFSLISFESLINAGHPYMTSDDEKYSCKDIQEAQNFAERIFFLFQNNNEYRRIVESIRWFKSAIFSKASYQMIFNALFSCLEALFGSPADGCILAKRISVFLKDFNESQDIENFIKNEYKGKRHSFSHGNPNIPWRDGIGKIISPDIKENPFINYSIPNVIQKSPSKAGPSYKTDNIFLDF